MAAVNPGQPLPGRLSRFTLVGGIGFIVDAGILTLLVNALGFGHYAGRTISFTVAVTVTWLANRNWVFHRDRSLGRSKEYARYVAVQVTGALINLSVYVLAIESFPLLARVPVIPLAIGAGVALLFNFSASRRLVFTGRTHE